MISDPRQNALDALNQHNQGRFHLDYIIQEFFNSGVRPMTQRERALFTTLVFGVTRWRGRLDWVIQQHSRIPLKKIRPDVQNILRMALFQIFFLDRIPESAAVNTAVDLAKKKRAGLDGPFCKRASPKRGPKSGCDGTAIAGNRALEIPGG